MRGSGGSGSDGDCRNHWQQQLDGDDRMAAEWWRSATTHAHQLEAQLSVSGLCGTEGRGKGGSVSLTEPSLLQAIPPLLPAPCLPWWYATAAKMHAVRSAQRALLLVAGKGAFGWR
jgi:TPR repeat protein